MLEVAFAFAAGGTQPSAPAPDRLEVPGDCDLGPSERAAARADSLHAVRGAAHVARAAAQAGQAAGRGGRGEQGVIFFQSLNRSCVA